MDVPIWLWGATLGAVFVMLAVDLFAHREQHEIGAREATRWSIVWITLGLLYGVFLGVLYDAEVATQYFAGFLIEKSLAVDNIFVFALLFTYFRVPRRFQHRILFYGVLGALVFRATFIALGAVLIEQFSWVLYFFGAFLVFTGVRMARHGDETMDPGSSTTVKLFRRVFPMTDSYESGRFIIREGGRRVATPLLMVLVLVEVSDIIFAVDSIPAIFAVTQEPFIVFASNVFAILGLRALYFLLADLVHRFVYLKLGLAVVLVWVGAKMLLLDVVHVPTLLSLTVVIVVISASVYLSLRATRLAGGAQTVPLPPDES